MLIIIKNKLKYLYKLKSQTNNLLLIREIDYKIDVLREVLHQYEEERFIQIEKELNEND